MKINTLFEKLPREENILVEYAMAKGLKYDDLYDFFNPTLENLENPSNYDNITEGAELLEKHISNNSKIAIVLHVDMDSMFTNSIIYNYLKGIDPSLDIDVVFPKTKSQGFNNNVMEHLRENTPDLVWIGDAGSSDYEHVKELHDLGVDVIITDHHTQSKDAREFGMDKYCVFINSQHSKNVLNKNGSGCLVTWKLMQHLDYMNGMDDSNKYIDIVALSLLSDVCDTLNLENRAILCHGLSDIKNPLMQETMRKLGKAKKPFTYPEEWGWNINPLFNGSIKMDFIEEIFWGLTEPDRETEWKQGTKRITIKKGTCLERALYTVRNKGKEKKPVVMEQFNRFDKEDNNAKKVIMAFDDGTTHKFLGGDVAGKFSSVYNKPSLMFMDTSEDFYTGSCRSPFGLKEDLQASGLFEFAEGHSPAFGFKIKKDNIPMLEEYLENLDISTESTHDVLAYYDNTNISPSLFELIDENIEVFAKGYENPMFAFKFTINGISIREINGGHFKFWKDGIDYIKFNPSNDLKEDLCIGENIELELLLVGKLSINEWGGNRLPQVIIQDIEVLNKEDGIKATDWNDIF